MIIEILTVGDELLKGTIVDTNSSYIAEQCEIEGHEVIRHISIGDDLTRLTMQLQEMSNRSEVMIISGGLGPTLDDLSREAAAKAINAELELFPQALSDIEAFFLKLDRTMPEMNKRQAYFPKGALYLPNPIGTAPGFVLKIGSSWAFFIPGVPREMRFLLHEQVFPVLTEKSKQTLEKLNISTLKTFGLSETSISQQLEVLESAFPQVKFGTRAHFPEIQIKLYARGKDSTQQLNKAHEAVHQLLDDWIFSEDENSMEMTVTTLLKKHGVALTIIERETGGLITDWLTNATSSSSCVSASFVLNMEKVSSALDDIDVYLIPNSELATQIAKHFHLLNGQTYTIAISGIINEEQSLRLREQIGTVHIAIAENDSINCYSCFLPYGGKEQKKKMFAMLALDLIRRKVIHKNLLSEVLGKPLKVNSLL